MNSLFFLSKLDNKTSEISLQTHKKIFSKKAYLAIINIDANFSKEYNSSKMKRGVTK